MNCLWNTFILKLGIPSSFWNTCDLRLTQSDQKVYYQKVDNLDLERAKNKIKHVLEEALNNKIITDEDFKAMDPKDKTPSKD